ncbi:MAG: hypothetical protein C4522_16240 [Desulfobacteraceae bacterium]|nr:MAG: hypothetical protein C4522_16240 [Desulfobacteraceae bacterium]
MNRIVPEYHQPSPGLDPGNNGCAAASDPIGGCDFSLFQKQFAPMISSIPRLMNASRLFQARMVRLILSREKHIASPDRIARFFGPYRMPGTSSIGLRKRSPELFQDTREDGIETYGHWIGRMINQTLKRMERCHASLSGKNLSEQFREELVEKIRIILEFRDEEGTPLCELIPQQMYEDVFITMILMILETDTAPAAPNLYKAFNGICHRLALSLISGLAGDGFLRPTDSAVRQLIYIAVLSGYVGINLKSSASAASSLLNRDLIPIPKHWVRHMKSVRAVLPEELDRLSRAMIDMSKNEGAAFGLDSTRMYFQEVIDAKKPTLLVFFCDDYMESLIDLKRFEIMITRNPRLDILFIPRNGRYGNDLAYSDMPKILKEPVFQQIARMCREGRLVISPYGPMAGCIDTRFISGQLMDQIETLSAGKTIILETKGCRNFEMLSGSLCLPWYTSFNCNRALSIRTVGIDMEPVFLRIPPGLKAYDGFAEPRTGSTPSGRSNGVKFARMTTLDLYNRLADRGYSV